MEKEEKDDSKKVFEQICDFIQKFSPCMDDYPYVMDVRKDLYYISEKVLDRFCMETNFFGNATEMHRKFVYADDVEMLIADVRRMVNGEQEEHNIQYRWLGKNREPIWINCRGRIINGPDGTPQFMVGCVNEIGRRPVADNVSGMLESSAMADEIEKCCKNWVNGYILRIGIDDFKEINERFGMEYGDFVLKGVGECVTKALKTGQIAYRVPADEFIIFDFVYGKLEDALALYRRIRSGIDAFIEANHYEAVYTISGGVLTNASLDNPTYQEIMKTSQFALSEAKERGKNQLYVFSREDYGNFNRRRNIRRAMRKSIADNFDGFEVFFQPIVNAATGKLHAAESLLRYTFPDGERVSPVEFVPILEETGLIIPVGKWVLGKAIEMCRMVRSTIPDFKVSVNLSYIQILKSPIADEICAQVEASGLSPDSMIIELTESGHLENTPSVRKVWEHLKEYGVSIAMDDFGTSYSNLQSIGNLTPHVVKLDHGFTVKALNNDYENRIMHHVVEMVHSLNLRICVEGIETEEELSKIKLLSPDYIQGFYYGKPCNKADFMKSFVI